MTMNCIESLSLQLIRSTKVTKETEIYGFFYKSGENYELRAGNVCTQAKLSKDTDLPKSVQNGSFVRVVAIPARRKCGRIRGTTSFSEELSLEIREIEVLSFLKFLQENTKMPHVMSVAKYFDLNTQTEFMHMIDDFLGGALYGIKLRAYRSALLGAPYVNLFDEQKSGGISTTYLPNMDTKVKNGDFFLKTLSMCFPSFLRFGINLRVHSSKDFEHFDQRDVILKKTRRKTKTQQRYVSFLDEWRPLRKYYKESNISGLHMDFELSRLNSEDRKYDCDELTSTAVSTLKVELPVMIGKEDIELIEKTSSRRLWDASEDISEEVFYRRIMFQPSFDESIVPEITERIFRSIAGIMNTDPYLSKAIGSKGAFNINQWVRSVIQIARSEARIQGKERISRDLISSALDASIGSRLAVLEAYTGSGPALGEEMGAISLRVLNFLRKEEVITEEAILEHFTDIRPWNIQAAIKELLEAGKAYEPEIGILKPVPT